MFQKLLRFLSVPGADPSSAEFTSSSNYGAYFSRLPVLETASLILRPLRMSDAADVYAYAADPEVARYVLWDPHTSLRDTRSYIRYIRALYRSGFPSSWGIVHRETNKVIGTIGFMWASGENRSAEVGYSLSRQYWNRGYATEALSAVIDSAFRTLNLHRIEAQRDVRNPASGRVMEKCGMQYEGTMRSRLLNKGEFIDVAVYAILRKEWEERGAFRSPP